MKRILGGIVFIFAALASVGQTGAVNGVCALGGAHAITQGLSATNFQQGVIPSCTVTVYLTGTTNKATLYANSSGNPLANPFTANAVGGVNPGGWLFHAAINQGYDVFLSGGIPPNVYMTPVTLTGLFAGGGGGGGGIPYPSGSGVPCVLGGTSWCSTYNANNQIPASYVTLPSTVVQTNQANTFDASHTQTFNGLVNINNSLTQMYHSSFGPNAAVNTLPPDLGNGADIPSSSVLIVNEATTAVAGVNGILDEIDWSPIAGTSTKVPMVFSSDLNMNLDNSTASYPPILGAQIVLTNNSNSVVAPETEALLVSLNNSGAANINGAHVFEADYTNDGTSTNSADSIKATMHSGGGATMPEWIGHRTLAPVLTNGSKVTEVAGYSCDLLAETGVTTTHCFESNDTGYSYTAGPWIANGYYVGSKVSPTQIISSTGAITAPSFTLNGGTPWTSSSSANSQVVTCPPGGTTTQICDAAGAWIASGGSSGLSGMTSGQLGVAGSASTITSSIAYATANTASTIVERDASSNINATTFTGALSGNATTATTAGSLTGALSANQLLGSLTAVAPTGQTVPSCYAAADALQWESGVGFHCNTSITANTASTATTATNLSGGTVAATTITGTSSNTLGTNGGTGGNLVLNGATSGSATISVSTTGVLALPSGTTATSMSLTTPSLGAATATSINKVAITAPTTSATITVADGTTLTETYSMNVAKTAGVAGAIPWYDTTTSESASALLVQYGVMIGGGASAAPSTIAASTTTTQALFATATAPAFRALALTDLPTITVPYGGTGDTTLTAYAPLFGGTTTTAAVQSGAVGTAGQALTSGGSAAIGAYGDLWLAEKIVPANCNNATAGNGFSLPTSAAPTVVCRTGTYVQTGYLQFVASESAQFQDEIPGDWDSANGPYVRVSFTQATATGSQSIIFTVAAVCSSTTDDTVFPAAQTFSTTTTGSTINTKYTQTLQLNSTTMANCVAGRTMNFQIATAAGSNATANLIMVTLTWPHKTPGVQEAN